MRTANPTLNERTLQRLSGAAAAPAPAFGGGYGGYAGGPPAYGAPPGYGAPARPYVDASRFTAEGAVTKTGILLVILLATAGATWVLAGDGVVGVLAPAAIAGLVVAIATAVKPQWARVTAPLYAAIEGVVIGGISLILDSAYPGVAAQAALGTFGVLAVMLVLYRTGVVKVTEKFRFGVMAATGAIALTYLASFVAGLFGASFGFLHGNGALSIGVSVVVIAVAALNLVLDFDFIEQAQARGAPKAAEWYAAFGLIVTLIWLYLELLRLLSKLQSRD